MRPCFCILECMNMDMYITKYMNNGIIVSEL